jgi:hypothetical protein
MATAAPVPSLGVGEQVSRFVKPERITLGSAVHCIACRERLMFNNGKFAHGSLLSGPRPCIAKILKAGEATK